MKLQKHFRKNMFCIESRVWVLLTAILILATAFPAFAVPVDSLDQWHWRNPLPQGNTLIGVTYGNGTFVAVGYAGTVLTSPDGVNWTNRTSGTSNLLGSVIWGNNTFVVVGDAGTVLTSPDGVSWTSRASGTSNSLHEVTWGNGTFVAVGDGTVLTSTDGVNWTSKTLGTSTYLVGVTWGNGTFVAVGEGSTTLISPDGVNWTRASDIYSPHGVTWGNNIGKPGDFFQWVITKYPMST